MIMIIIISSSSSIIIKKVWILLQTTFSILDFLDLNAIKLMLLERIIVQIFK